MINFPVTPTPPDGYLHTEAGRTWRYDDNINAWEEVRGMTAASLNFNPAASGLDATDIQAAVDELAAADGGIQAAIDELVVAGGSIQAAIDEAGELTSAVIIQRTTAQGTPVGNITGDYVGQIVRVGDSAPYAWYRWDSEVWTDATEPSVTLADLAGGVDQARMVPITDLTASERKTLATYDAVGGPWLA